jgi:hypothetical protein
MRLLAFSFITVDFKDVIDAFMAVKSDASLQNSIVIYFIFTCSEFPSRRKCAVVLPSISIALRVSLIFVQLVFLRVCPRFVRFVRLMIG